MRHLLILACLLFAHPAAAETLTFEIYELMTDGGRQLLAKGSKHYELSDIEVQRSLVGEVFWMKQLPLTDRFGVGASIHHDKELVGFGLWVRQRPKWFEFWKDRGFSWDWFNREQPPIYQKLQGPGRVRATIVKGSNFEALTSVEFLDDITLRLNASPWFFFSMDDTHHVVVRKGSVLKLAP
jgi:hypothetical protein